VLREELREQITIDVNSQGAKLLQKTEKDLAEAMAENYIRIASVIPDMSEPPYWRLIIAVVYIEAAREYAKCEKQDDLQYVLEAVESRIVIKLSKKHKKSAYQRDVYRHLYSLILRNVYDIRSIIGERGYEFHLLESIEEKVKKACDELNKQ